MGYEQIILIAFVLLLSGFAYASFKGAPWVPTRKKDLDYILNNINIPDNAVVYDLGSGDGRAVFYFAQNRNVKKAVGFELAWPLVLFSKIKKSFLNSELASKVEFKFANFLTADVAVANIVFCFLMPDTIETIFSDIFQKMKPGSAFISAVFPVKNLEATKTLKRSEKDCSYYVYVK